MATLESLPAELIILIANHVKAANCSLTPLAVISKQCQMHVEPLIFSNLSICTSELPHFSQLLNRPRFLALRNLTYRVEDIASHDPSDGLTRISADARAAYGEAFTDAIIDILTVLKEKGDSVDASHPGIYFNLCASYFPESIYLSPEASVTDSNQDDESNEDDQGDETDEDDRDDESSEDDGAPDPNLRRAWVKMTEEGLPVVPIVTVFRNQDAPVSRLFKMLWPQSWSALLSRLPRVETVQLYAFDDERKAPRSREEARDAFGLSLQSLPVAVTDVSLEYLSYPPGNQFRNPPRLTDQRLGYDVFSHELGRLSQRLVTLVLHDATLNLADFFTCSTPDEWPRLQELTFAALHPGSTDGTWYFNVDARATMEEYEEVPGTDPLDDIREWMGEDELPAAMDVPLNLFRTAIDPAKFKEIYLAVAQAVKRMPKLQKLDIEFDLQGASNIGLGQGDHFFYYTVGEAPIGCKSSTADINVQWNMVPAIKIDDDILEAWREVGATKDASIALYLRDQLGPSGDYGLLQ